MSDPRSDSGEDHQLPSEPAPPGARADVVRVLGVYLGLGVLGAVLWWLLAEPAHFTVTESGGLGMGEVELARRFSADGWFVVIAALLGLLAGGGLTWWRDRDMLLTACLVVAGALLATVVMAGLGWMLGPDDPNVVAAGATAGELVPARLEVTAKVAYLVWPISSLAGALTVLWSPSADFKV